MRCQIQLPEPIIGFSESCARSGEKVKVRWMEFTSSEDGDKFVRRLEELQACLISKIPGCPSPSQIDHLLAVVGPDLHATIIVNELQPLVHIRAKRDVNPGDPLLMDHILDVGRMNLGVSTPGDHAIVFIFSLGWRKSLFFDFGALSKPPILRTYDLEVLLGQQYAYLLFQDQFKISELQWQNLFEAHWFPFRHLPHDIVRRMLNLASQSWPIDEILEDPKLEEAILAAQNRPQNALQSSAFAEHRDLLVHAFERYAAQDYQSCVALLYPRIEGILRSIQAQVGTGSPTAAGVVDTATLRYEQALGSRTMLLPDKFRDFLTHVYFRGWHPGDPPEHVSRHTVSHGVAPVEKFDRKAAMVGILTVLQIGLYLDPELGPAGPSQSDVKMAISRGAG